MFEENGTTLKESCKCLKWVEMSSGRVEQHVIVRMAFSNALMLSDNPMRVI